MAQVTVTKEPPVAKRKTPPPARFDDFLTTIFPISPATRFFGPSPFALWRAMAGDRDGAFGLTPHHTEDFWTPVVDVRKCHGDLVVTAELPGLRNDDIKVELAGDALLIQGARRNQHKEDHEGYHRSERSYARFYRSIPLPGGAKTDRIKAELTDGVLKVSIPVPETEKQPRHIPVQAGAPAGKGLHK